jgi:enoyl-CoA hydratase/carnithine racemase
MIEIHDQGPVRELRLARLPVNALGTELLQRLDAELVAARDAGQRALVISGLPGVFSAGLDMRELLAMNDEGVRHFVEQFERVQERIARSPIPVVAAITGHCPAGGTVLAMLCDHRVMARGAYQIGLNEVQVGLYLGNRLFRAFQRLVGGARAAALLPRGAMLDPVEALAAGLVDELCEPDAVVPRARALAAELVALPPQAYARTRSLVRRDLIRLFDEPEEDRTAIFGAGAVTGETRERMTALLGGGR